MVTHSDDDLLGTAPIRKTKKPKQDKRMSKDSETDKAADPKKTVKQRERAAVEPIQSRETVESTQSKETIQPKDTVATSEQPPMETSLETVEMDVSQEPRLKEFLEVEYETLVNRLQNELKDLKLDLEQQTKAQSDLKKKLQSVKQLEDESKQVLSKFKALEETNQQLLEENKHLSEAYEARGLEFNSNQNNGVREQFYQQLTGLQIVGHKSDGKVNVFECPVRYTISVPVDGKQDCSYTLLEHQPPLNEQVPGVSEQLKDFQEQALQQKAPEIVEQPFQYLKVKDIADAQHPAFGQKGLFTTKKIKPKQLLLDYIGQVYHESQVSQTSDYVIHFFNEFSIDAEKRGNNGRFVNDYRGIGQKPNSKFDLYFRNKQLRIGIFSVTEIPKGSEILVSYGKGFWRELSLCALFASPDKQLSYQQLQSKTTLVYSRLGQSKHVSVQELKHCLVGVEQVEIYDTLWTLSQQDTLILVKSSTPKTKSLVLDLHLITVATNDWQDNEILQMMGALSWHDPNKYGAIPYLKKAIPDLYHALCGKTCPTLLKKSLSVVILRQIPVMIKNNVYKLEWNDQQGKLPAGITFSTFEDDYDYCLQVTDQVLETAALVWESVVNKRKEKKAAKAAERKQEDVEPQSLVEPRSEKPVREQRSEQKNKLASKRSIEKLVESHPVLKLAPKFIPATVTAHPSSKSPKQQDPSDSNDVQIEQVKNHPRFSPTSETRSIESGPRDAESVKANEPKSDTSKGNKMESRKRKVPISESDMVCIVVSALVLLRKRENTSASYRLSTDCFTFLTEFRQDMLSESMSNAELKAWALPRNKIFKFFNSHPHPKVMINNQCWELSKTHKDKNENLISMKIVDPVSDQCLIPPQQMIEFALQKPDLAEYFPHDVDAFDFKVPAPPAVVLDEQFEKALEQVIHRHPPLDRTRFLQRMQRIIDQAAPGFCRLALFGSSLTGLGFGTSDVDMSLIPLQLEDFDHKYANVRTLGKLFKAAGMRQVEVITGARVPIVKFYDPVESLNVDLNVGHSLGVHNSGLLKAYTELDPRVKPLIMLVKYWAKRKDINDPAELHRKILPSLQQLYTNPERQVAHVPHVGHRRNNIKFRLIDVSYDNGIPQQAPENIWEGELGIPNLFYQFMRYFGYQHSYTSGHWVSVKLGGFVKHIPMSDARDIQLVVEDPFEEDRNCAGSCDWSLPVVVAEFRVACSRLEEKKPKIALLFSEFKRKRPSDNVKRRRR
ncbi:hypothetical protein EDD86DRAFT_245480 [Gorgonomyces haynaldii]|nr:hypothetical protein EDD86DRAFT_245480 [Gorgonomyces haynaldii]